MLIWFKSTCGCPRSPLYFISQPITLLKVDETYHYPLQAADADGDMISYTLLSGPLNIDADGLLSWQPTIDDLGQYKIKVEASDRYGATALQQFTLYLLEAGNNAPVIISEANTQLRLEQGPYYYQVQAIDADGQAVTFQLLDAPQGMTIDSLSGKIDWQAEQTQLGSHNIQIRATDSDGQSSEQSYQLQVTNTGPWNRRLCR